MIEFIVNPNAGNGRAGKIWRRRILPRLRSEGVAYRVHLTEAPGDAIRRARRSADQVEALVSVGGDGTHNEVVTGLMESGQAEQPLVGFLTLGTGGDLRKTLGLPVDPLIQLEAILGDVAARRRQPFDYGRLEYVDHEGRPAVRAFVNIASFGISGLVDDLVNRTTKAFGGTVSFLVGSVRATLAYHNQEVRLTIDGEELPPQRIYLVAVGNGRYFGGGMHAVPTARPDDGLFDVLTIGDLTFRQKLRLAPRIYRATHLDLEGVTIRQARTLTATSDETVLLDVDGEQPGRLPATFTIVPEGLRVVGARLAPDGE